MLHLSARPRPHDGAHYFKAPAGRQNTRAQRSARAVVWLSRGTGLEHGAGAVPRGLSTQKSSSQRRRRRRRRRRHPNLHSLVLIYFHTRNGVRNSLLPQFQTETENRLTENRVIRAPAVSTHQQFPTYSCLPTKICDKIPVGYPLTRWCRERHIVTAANTDLNAVSLRPPQQYKMARGAFLSREQV